MMKCLTSIVLLSFASFLTFLMPCLFWFHGGLVPNDTFYFITSLFMTASRQRWPQTHLAASTLPLGRCIFNPREYLTQSEVWQHAIKSVFQPSRYEHTNIQWEMKQNMPVSAERENTHLIILVLYKHPNVNIMSGLHPQYEKIEQITVWLIMYHFTDK